jgi:hypothetical protein
MKPAIGQPDNPGKQIFLEEAMTLNKIYFSRYGQDKPGSAKYALILLVLSILLVSLLNACSQQASGGLKVGDVAPDFTLQDTSGNPVSLSDYKGKQPVLLYFHMAVG